MDYTSTGAAPVKTGKADRRADLPFLVITPHAARRRRGDGALGELCERVLRSAGETGHNPVYFFSRQAIFAAAGVCVMLIARAFRCAFTRLCAAAAARFRRKPCGSAGHRHGRKRCKTMDKSRLHDVPAVRNYKNRNYSLLFGADMQI